jgi:hypothetical protein
VHCRTTGLRLRVRLPRAPVNLRSPGWDRSHGRAA